MTGWKDSWVSPARWLLGSRAAVSPAIRAQLQAGLFTSLPIFIGGVINSIAIAAIAIWRHSAPEFLIWFCAEIGLGLARLPLIAKGRKALRNNQQPPLLITALLSCAWSASVGFGACISILSEDWLLATIVCLSAAAMVCGICLRNFGTPRLAALMVFLMLAPSAVAGPMTREPVLFIFALQLPTYMLAIFSAAFGFHALFVSRITALNDLQSSELFNRSILETSPDYTLILGEDRLIIFCNRPDGSPEGTEDELIGVDWLTLLHPDDRQDGEHALEVVAGGRPANLTTHHVNDEGETRWFDIIASPILDGSGRTMIVARDMTNQKATEAQAVWMSRHDPLTGLGNRSVLQEELDKRLADSRAGEGSALLIVDIDHFKTINDTLGHDAGDALLCTFAERLNAATGRDDLVTRTGGDEFALLVSANTLTQVEKAAASIYAHLADPFVHQGRLLECSASIGASILLKDGQSRSEVMKAADIALYAAKASGRGQMKIFDHAMKVEVDRQHAMVAAGRLALRNDRVLPYYHSKVALRTGEIVGFEALMRWTDSYDMLRSPEDLRGAFEDPRLAIELSDRMIDKVLDQMQSWSAAGVAFGHVAINVTANDFRRSGFADDLLRRLADRAIDPSLLQLEVTETVFLGRTASYVEAALRLLSKHGIRIALDDFGTGYASLSHLKQFPVDLLKIDRAFVQELGRDAEAEAITAAVVNLGHCLGMEVIAEGVEDAAQEAKLLELGCDAAQGYKYSRAVPADDVPRMLALAEEPSRRRRA